MILWNARHGKSSDARLLALGMGSNLFAFMAHLWLPLKLACVISRPKGFKGDKEHDEEKKWNQGNRRSCICPRLPVAESFSFSSNERRMNQIYFAVVWTVSVGSPHGDRSIQIPVECACQLHDAKMTQQGSMTSCVCFLGLPQHTRGSSRWLSLFASWLFKTERLPSSRRHLSTWCSFVDAL